MLKKFFKSDEAKILSDEAKILGINGAMLATVFGAVVGGKFLFNDPGKSESTLLNQGYKNIVVDNAPTILACGKDFLGNGFRATNPAGQETSGYVCRGLLFKGATIRFE